MATPTPSSTIAASNKPRVAAAPATRTAAPSNPMPIEERKKLDLTAAPVFDINTSGVMESLTKLLFEGTSILSKLKPEEFEMFGKMSSHEYRKLFFKVTKDLDEASRIWIIVLFTAIKSKPRVLNAMIKFNKEPWYNMTRDFITQKMVQYTRELPMDNSRFAAVHVPHIMPSFTAICWLKITKPALRTVQNFLENLWACQMDIPSELMERQKFWEVNFWNHTVMISRNVTRDNTPLEFNEQFWATKSADKYPFYNPAGEEHPVRSEKDLQTWLDTWSAYVKV